MIYKTKGIILKRTNLGEADRIVTILTEKHGKIKVIAKGVRKTLSKMAGHLEPFCLSKLEIAKGRNLDIIAGAEVQKCFHSLRSDFEKTKNSFYLGEIVDKMLEEGEPHPEIYHLLDDTLEHLNLILAPLLKPYFEINLLKELGLNLELYHCLVCRQSIKAGDNLIDFDHGGVICQICGQGRPVSDDTVKILRLMTQHHFNAIKKIKVSEGLIKEVQKIASAYLKYYYQKEFKSERYLAV